MTPFNSLCLTPSLHPPGLLPCIALRHPFHCVMYSPVSLVRIISDKRKRHSCKALHDVLLKKNAPRSLSFHWLTSSLYWSFIFFPYPPNASTSLLSFVFQVLRSFLTDSPHLSFVSNLDVLHRLFERLFQNSGRFNLASCVLSRFVASRSCF